MCRAGFAAAEAAGAADTQFAGAYQPLLFGVAFEKIDGGGTFAVVVAALLAVIVAGVGADKQVAVEISHDVAFCRAFSDGLRRF